MDTVRQDSPSTDPTLGKAQTGRGCFFHPLENFSNKYIAKIL